jgi:uncharacterized glyoxalase superfamily protein PhnB
MPEPHADSPSTPTITPHIVVRDADRAAAWYVQAHGAGALNIDTDDVDALWARALEAGAEVFHPLQDAFWGDRNGQIVDPFGHRWSLSQHLRDVPAEEIAAAAAAMFGG